MVKKSRKGRIRPLALCVFRRGDKIFVARGHDGHTRQTFYRPVGGAIKFGEPAAAALKREVMEELDAAVEGLRYLGALENIFRYEGKAGHEIALIFDGRFTDPDLNRDDLVLAGKDSGEILYEAMWLALDDFRGSAAPPLYPAGLLALLDGAAAADIA